MVRIFKRLRELVAKFRIDWADLARKRYEEEIDARVCEKRKEAEAEQRFQKTWRYK